ncbi:MAG: tyrosine-type recombinase/integrase [Actinomycetes bacterium]
MRTPRPTKRCGCRDDAGKQLGAACPRLKSSRHGAWWVRVDLPPDPVSGRRRQRRLGPYPTAAAAESARRAASAHLSSGGTLVSITVAEYLTGWLAGAVDLRPSTRASYTGHVNTYLVPHLGHHRLDRLRPEHVEEMFAAIIEGNGARRRPVGPATLRRVHATLNSALSAAARRRLIPGNPAQWVRLPAAPHVEVQPWSASELGAFLDAVSDDRWALLYEVSALVGLRRGEALGLRWSDVDLVAGLLHVRSNRVQVGGRVLTGAPKTRSGERVVDVDPGLVDLLARLKDRTEAERDVLGASWDEDSLVFVEADGTAPAPEVVSKRFVRAARRAGVREVTFHSLRHCSASLQLAAGVSLTVVSKRLGHSSVGITADTYSHMIRDVGQDAAVRTSAMVPRRLVVPTSCPPEPLDER